MGMDWIRKVFGKASLAQQEVQPIPTASAGSGAAQATSSEIEFKWIEAANNPWGVRLLDVRPVTQTMLSTSADPQCAANAISFGRDDGQGFIGQNPRDDLRLSVDLRYPIDQCLADGVLFIPQEMEHKWALFVHQQSIICVRSWTREVHAIAHFKAENGCMRIHELHGSLLPNSVDPDLNQRLLDFLLRSHALNLPYPVPLPDGLESTPKAAAFWCMGMFGKLAMFATQHQVAHAVPDKPLRTHSLLHIAVARGDMDAARARLQSSDPIDLLAGDGLAPLHWALAATTPRCCRSWCKTVRT